MPDADDLRLLAHVRPDGWLNPTPRPRYDLVVIGGGTAGLVCAAGGAGLGARVALVERLRLGGDCLNFGCVPSKAMLRSARAVAAAQAGSAVGVRCQAAVDFAAVMARLRARRADIAPHDSAERLRALGVDVFFGDGTFADRTTVVVAGHTRLRFRKAVIATGSRPALPPIPGLESVTFLTNETVFTLTAPPETLAVVGAGPAGCELAQALALLGSRVVLIDEAAHVLPREDPDAGAIVARRLAAAGVDLRLGTRVTRVTRSLPGVTLSIGSDQVAAAALLVTTGRAPNTERLDLDAAGVAHDASGIKVDDRLRTTNADVYASGDVCSRFKFTHAADALSRVVLRNALFFGRKRASALVIPWCTFTAPEVAHVGISAVEAGRHRATTITIPLADVDRAVVDDEMDGFVRLHHRDGRILGATIVASAAGEIVGTVALAMQKGGTLSDLGAAIFPYPTVSTALRQAGDAYGRTRLTPAVRRALHYYFRRPG